jgi:hypothetical protein
VYFIGGVFGVQTDFTLWVGERFNGIVKRESVFLAIRAVFCSSHSNFIGVYPFYFIQDKYDYQ